jgi:hypothetical protein
MAYEGDDYKKQQNFDAVSVRRKVQRKVYYQADEL